MRFSLFIQSPPSSHGAALALRFARAALAGGHSIRQVFFHADGVLALAPGERGADEVDLDREWRRLSAEHDVSLLACHTAAARRGVVAADRAAVRPGSLAQFYAALDGADRLVGF